MYGNFFLITVCRFLPDKGNRYGYLFLEHSGLRFRACPYGTEFNAQQCGCTWVPKESLTHPRNEGNLDNKCKQTHSNSMALFFDQWNGNITEKRQFLIYIFLN